MRIRMPVWLALLLVVAVAVGAAAVFVSRSVSLGRAVDGAMDVQASVTIYNETVDRRDIPAKPSWTSRTGYVSSGPRRPSCESTGSTAERAP